LTFRGGPNREENLKATKEKRKQSPSRRKKKKMRSSTQKL